MSKPLVLSYEKCGTCKKALTWLKSKGVQHDVRPLIDEPPTAKELERWISASKLDIRKWLNTSGLSYRALGKEKIDAASEATLLKWLAADAKLIKRPVLVTDAGVTVGFREDAFKALLKA